MRGGYGRVNGYHQDPRGICWCEWIKAGKVGQHGCSDERAVRAQGGRNEGIRSEGAGESCQQDHSSATDIGRKHGKAEKAEEKQRRPIKLKRQ